MGRCTELEGVQEESELALSLLRRDAEEAEDPLLELGLVDTDRPRAQFPSVEREVVGLGPHGERVRLESVEIVDVGMGEGMVGRNRVPGVGHTVEHREVDDPQEAEALVDRGLTELETQRSEHGAHRVELARLEEQ